MKKINRILIVLVATFSLFFLSSPLFAKEITLYDAPSAAAKSVGKIDLSTGIIPIFAPKDSTWLKVADPRNGNVGWIKSSDINTAGTPATFSFTQKIMTDGKNPNTYQVIQFGQPVSITDKQVNEMMNKMKMQQEAAQLYLQKAAQDMMNTFKNLFPSNMLNNGGPYILPIVIIPAQQKTPAAPAKANPAKP